MSDYYCWEQYWDAGTAKQTKSDEIRYYTGHQHGVMPTEDQWESCLNNLVGKVNAIRSSHNPPLPLLSKDTIKQGAERKTRSAH